MFFDSILSIVFIHGSRGSGPFTMNLRMMRFMRSKGCCHFSQFFQWEWRALRMDPNAMAAAMQASEVTRFL